MNQRQTNALRLSVLAVAAALLFGCGGGGGDSASDTLAASPTEIVQMANSSSALSVRIATSSDGSVAPLLLAQSRYNLSATVTAGPSAGRSLTGLLMLKSKKEDGGTEVEGRFMPTGVSSGGSVTPDVQAQVDALRAELGAKLDMLQRDFRTDIASLIQSLKSALVITGSGDGLPRDLTPEQRAAIARFKDGFAAHTATYANAVQAAMLDFRNRVDGLGVGSSAGRSGDADADADADGDSDGDGDDDDGKEHGDDRRGYEVKGTIAADGQVELSFRRDDRVIVRAVGQVAANGNITGTFTGPADGDKGDLSATLADGASPPPSPPPPPPSPSPSPSPSPPSPSPSPSPSPMVNVAAGQVKYGSFCATCHGPNANANQLRVKNATTVAQLDAANARVGAMRSLATSMTSQDKLDVTAYIASLP